MHSSRDIIKDSGQQTFEEKEFQCLQVELHPTDDVILIDLVQFHKIAAPSPDPHDEVAVLLWVFLSIKHLLTVNSIQLKL